ncbi:MAG: hypothetical protein K2N37_05195 [Lachnospiraceae bacterium]|nr:hypothetical protein [Lachnospiraceae bacterium]
MTTTELEERATELKEMTGDFMGDEITFTRLDFCLLGAVLFLAGVCIGLLTAPFTHGISIGSHNGCNNGNNNGHNENSSVGARAE